MKSIINKYRNNIKSIIKNLTGSINEDLEQEVYIRTWKNLNKYREQGKFKQWINTITSNICKDYLKSSYVKNQAKTADIDKYRHIEIKKEDIINDIEIKSRRKKVAKAIINLKPKFREVIELYEIEGMSYEEISCKLKCPTGTIKSRIYKARQELYEQLKEIL